MPRATVNKLYRTFVKGLITEAGPLTYPENASINEDNCIIYQAGNRSRRLGVDYEAGFQQSSFTTPASMYGTTAATEFVWQSPGNDSRKNILVQQVGSTLYFYDMTQAVISTHRKPYTVDLSVFAVGGQSTVNMPIQAISGKGFFFVVGAAIDPFIIVYEPATDTITTQAITIQIRDFKGLNDGLANDEEPSSLSNEHNYNLLNQGWIDPGTSGSGSSVTYYDQFGYTDTFTQGTTTNVTAYHTATGRYPSNSQEWWVGKNATTGAFDASLLTKFYFGSSHAPKGHYVVNAFNIDRSAVSGIGSIPVESITNRPTACTFFSGRIWYAIDSTVYFSQVLDDKRKAGFCYMEADPTSEQISDLIATDGGVIPIPEMIKVCAMIPIGGGVLVFAKNGLWFVSGTSSGFTATDISVTKIGPIGTESPYSICHVQVAGNDMLLYWTKIGIMGLNQRMGTFGAIDNKFDTNIISIDTIQSFYRAIPAASLPYVKANYDPNSNVVQWLFNSGNVPYNFAYDRVLNFDLTLKAFYPWTFTPSDPTYGPFITGVFDPITPSNLRNSLTRYLCITGVSSQFYYSFADVLNTNYADWNANAYTSFVETGYELLDDAMRDKQANYVYTYFRRTEDAWVTTDGGATYNFHNPSSCYMQIKWDWSSSSVSNRWSAKQQAYRINRMPTLDENNLAVDTGFPIVVSRNKVRGAGRAIQFRFENHAIGSNFDLLGWAVPYSGNTNP